jgi:CheY-like chemotaxis protein
MFFDDYPQESVNQLFLHELKLSLESSDIRIVVEKTIPHLEALLRARDYMVVILDIMAAFPDEPDVQAMAGLEVLKRCRAGEYGVANSRTPVYMRTARGELWIKELAFKLGCTEYFTIGSQDDKLLEALARLK